MKTIVFYGDSNTYGFDPRGFGGGRYPVSSIWTTLVQEALGSGWAVRNEGMNGRSLPAGLRSTEEALRVPKGLKHEDVFAIMLGSNDLLMSLPPDAERAIARMASYLDKISEWPDCPHIFVIAPCHIGSPNSSDPMLVRFYEESIKMNEGFRRLAVRYGAAFADSSAWDIGLAFDGLHFSEEGHRQFADALLETLRRSGVCAETV